MGQPTISMSDAMLEAVDTQPGNNRSKWICEAVEMRLFIEGLEEDADTPDELPNDWWQNALEEHLNEREQPASIEA
jgi:hypothetical protein